MAIFSYFIAALAAGGFTGAITIFGLSPALSAAIIQVGKSLLWSQLSKLVAPGAPKEQVQATIGQAAGPRIRGYGEFLLGGTRALWEAKDGILHQIVVSHHGPISSLIRYEVDGEAVDVDGLGNVTSGGATDYLQIQSILSGDGGVYPAATAAFPTIWTAAHKLTGQATFYTRMKAPKPENWSKVFPRQSQTAVAIVAQLSPVKDPRTGIVGYSNLTGPCLMDFLINADGYRIPESKIHTAGFIDFTNLCDENVVLKSGGTEKRYQVGGYYSLEDAPKDVLARILATADAQCYMTAEGTIGVMGGEWIEPDVTITHKDILDLSMTDGADEFTDFNVLKGKFVSPLHRFQDTEVSEWRNEVSLLTQSERIELHIVDLCPSHTQMQRLMEAFKARKLPEFTGTMTTNLVGLKARFPRGKGRHLIKIVDEDESEFIVEVLSHSYNVPGRTCEITFATTVNGYLWDPETQERPAPPPLDSLNKPTYVDQVPSGLAVSQEVVRLSLTQNAVRAVLQVSAPIREDLQLQAEYRRTSGPSPNWQPMLVGLGDLRAYTDGLSDGVEYEIRASWIGVNVWATPVTVTAVSNPVAPDAPSSFISSELGGTVTLDWVNGDSGYYRTRVYRSPTTDFNDASLLAPTNGVAGLAGQPSTYDDTPGTGTWSYWVLTINPSSLESAPVGPTTHTI